MTPLSALTTWPRMGVFCKGPMEHGKPALSPVLHACFNCSKGVTLSFWASCWNQLLPHLTVSFSLSQLSSTPDTILVFYSLLSCFFFLLDSCCMFYKFVIYAPYAHLLIHQWTLVSRSEPEDIMLSEINQKQKDKSCMIILTCGILKKKKILKQERGK